MMSAAAGSSKALLRSVAASRRSVRPIGGGSAGVASWMRQQMQQQQSRMCVHNTYSVLVLLRSSPVFASSPLSLQSLAAVRVRSFSAAATTNGASPPSTTSTTSTTTGTDKDNKDKDKSKTTNNAFLDNLGTIFLSAIGMVVAWLMRSYYNTVRRNLLRDSIENTAAADPIELDDLRVANSEVTVQVFTEIQHHVLKTCQNHDPLLTYPDFVKAVRTAMVQLKGDAFTIQLGYLMDRVAADAVLKQQRGSSSSSSSTTILDTKMPVQFWLTVLSLALAGTPADRIHVLYQIMLKDNAGTNNSAVLSIDQVVALVGYLQDTCQLPPDAQIVETVHKYPLQEYAIGTPAQLVDRQQWEKKRDSDETAAANVANDPCNNIDVDAFAAILRSKSVCAWGECYHKKKFR